MDVIQTSDSVGKSGSDDDCEKSGYSCRKNINKRGEESEANKIGILHMSILCDASHQDACKRDRNITYTTNTVQALAGDLIRPI